MERDIKYIAVHCTASPQHWGVAELNRVFKQRGFKRPGYHYVITKDGVVHPMESEERYSNGVKGFNMVTINVAYVGGIDSTGKGVDNRTPEQKEALRELLKKLKAKYPKAKIQGHRDFSEDKNGYGIIDPWERIKECPCFDAIPEYKDL